MSSGRRARVAVAAVVICAASACGGRIDQSSGGSVTDPNASDAGSAIRDDGAAGLEDAPSTNAGDASAGLYNATPPARTCAQRTTEDGTMTPIDDGHGGAYCMDVNEVTELAYNDFVTSNPPASKVAGCEGRTDFRVVVSDVCSAPDGTSQFPATCVDWCDAASFCAWSGKRLCGRIGGGSITNADADDATVDQWYRACSAGDAREYPYGSQYEPAACNAQGSQSGGGDRSYQPVGFFSDCTDATHKVFDLSGNAEEWEDACTGDSCHVRGGSYQDVMLGALTCSSPARAQKTDAEPYRGFRCCAD